MSLVVIISRSSSYYFISSRGCRRDDPDEETAREGTEIARVLKTHGEIRGELPDGPRYDPRRGTHGR